MAESSNKEGRKRGSAMEPLEYVKDTKTCPFCFSTEHCVFKFLNNRKPDQPRYKCMKCKQLHTHHPPEKERTRPHGKKYTKPRLVDPPELQDLKPDCPNEACGAIGQSHFLYYNNNNKKQPRYGCKVCGFKWQPFKCEKRVRMKTSKEYPNGKRPQMNDVPTFEEHPNVDCDNVIVQSVCGIMQVEPQCYPPEASVDVDPSDLSTNMQQVQQPQDYYPQHHYLQDYYPQASYSQGCHPQEYYPHEYVNSGFVGSNINLIQVQGQGEEDHENMMVSSSNFASTNVLGGNDELVGPPNGQVSFNNLQKWYPQEWYPLEWYPQQFANSGLTHDPNVGMIQVEQQNVEDHENIMALSSGSASTHVQVGGNGESVSPLDGQVSFSASVLLAGHDRVNTSSNEDSNTRTCEGSGTSVWPPDEYSFPSWLLADEQGPSIPMEEPMQELGAWAPIEEEEFLRFIQELLPSEFGIVV